MPTLSNLFSMTLVATALACVAQSPALAQSPLHQSPQRGNETQLAESLNQVVMTDAQSWMFNRYDAGSITNAQVLSRSQDGRSAFVYGEYTFNGGLRGWIKARIEDEVFVCVEFWDFFGRCRPVGQSYSRTVATQLVLQALTQSASPGSSSGQDADGFVCNDICEAEQLARQQAEMAKYQ